MKNKLVFRILGALASALIIASVFIPFVSVLGYSPSLWQINQGTLYLPIMIIVFGLIGVIFFSINIKTEFAYSTSGALLFYLIMQTVPAITSGTFKTFGVGYYCLVVGTLLTCIMAFLSNLKSNKKEVIKQEEETENQISMIDQIDRLYNDQGTISNSIETNPLDNIIQPLPVMDLNPIPVQNVEQINETNISNSIPVPENNVAIAQNQTIQNTNVINNTVDYTSMPVNNTIVNQNAVSQNMEMVQNNEISNPVIAEFNMEENSAQQNVLQNQDVSSNNTQNPVISEFNVPNSDQIIEQQTSNPVLAQFTNELSQGSFVSVQQNQTDLESNATNEVEDVIQPLGTQSNVNLMADNKNNNNNSNLDIFG